MDTREENAPKTTDIELLKLRTDSECKKLLANKLILTCILKTCTREFSPYHVNIIEQCIEGEPEVGTVGVFPDTTNKTPSSGEIRGMNCESTSDTEGRVTFDVRFCAITPGKARKRSKKKKTTRRSHH